MVVIPEKVRFLGQGQFGDVWEARFCQQDHLVVALKVIRDSKGGGDPKWDREVRMLQTTSQHPVIVNCLGFSDHPQPWIAMEFCDGGSFNQLVKVSLIP